jgi:hypothetical protein
MKKELTVSLIIVLALVAVSLLFRHIFLNPPQGFLNASYRAALIAAAAGLLALFAAFVKRILIVKN